MTSTGAGQPWTTSRGTLKTKSAFVTYIRVRNLSIMSIVSSGRCLTSRAPGVHAVVVHGVRFLAEADGVAHDRGEDALGRALDTLPDDRPADAVADHH